MKSKYLQKATLLIKNTDAVFAYVSGWKTIKSDKKGIGFLCSLCDRGANLSKGAVADKIVGKAAALLFVLLRVNTVYAETISKGASEVFERYGIHYEFGVMTEHIVNRTGTGLCPMENAVKDIDEPKKAYHEVKKTLEMLAGK